MAIKEKFVTVKWSNNTRKHYESLGYIWTGQFKEFEIPIEHLTVGANIIITAICDQCSKERSFKRLSYRDLCFDCASKKKCSNPKNIAALRERTMKLWQNEEFVEKIKKIRRSEVGPLNKGWNPNLTDEQRITGRYVSGDWSWANDVKVRDNFTCQICYQYKGKLNSHHIMSYHANPSLRQVIDNGVTLCRNCHINFHFYFGQKNNTKSQFEEFSFYKKLNNIISMDAYNTENKKV